MVGFCLAARLAELKDQLIGPNKAKSFANGLFLHQGVVLQRIKTGLQILSLVSESLNSERHIASYRSKLIGLD